MRIAALLPAKRSERPLTAVPWPVLAALALGLAAQLAWHAARPAPETRVAALPAPPSPAVLQVAGFGENAALSRVLMLWLQSFDQQPGVSVAFRELDYARLAVWLGRILDLDPRSHYPLLSAARVYGEVPDDARKRAMIAFVRERFLRVPDERWPWMAHAVYLAKYRLQDLPLALDLARELRLHTTGDVPSWARQMELFVLEDMGDLEGARILLGGLIESGVVSDPNELRFLHKRLDRDAPP